MTKTSDRFAKWFGSRVPLVSRGGLTLATTVAMLPFSVVVHIAFGYTIFYHNWLIALGLTLIVSVLFHTLYLLILKIRYSVPMDHHWLQDLVGRVHQKAVVPSRVEVWIRQSVDTFIVSTFNPLFDAVIISESMVNLIQESPESGEVLVAFHMFRTPEKKWFGDYIGGVLLFIILTYVSASTLVPLSIVLFQSIMISPYLIMYLVSALSSFIIGPLIFILLVKGAFWRHEPAFVAVQEIYGKHPQVAKVEVERGRVLTEEETQSVIWGVRQWEKRKRGGRKAGLTTLAGVSSWALYMLLVLVGGVPWGYPYYYLMAYLPYLIALVVMLVVYFWLRHWDSNAMGTVFKKTTDFDEPIWMD